MDTRNMDDFQKTGEKMSRGAQMMSSLPPLSWFTKPLDGDWTSGGCSRDSSEYVYPQMTSGQAFLPRNRLAFPHQNSHDTSSLNHKVPRRLNQFNLAMRGVTPRCSIESPPCVIMQGSQMFIINPSSTSAMAYQQQQQQQQLPTKDNDTRRWEAYHHEQMLNAHMPMVCNDTSQNKKQRDLLPGVVPILHDQNNCTSAPLDLTKKSPMNVHQRLRRISAPAQLQDLQERDNADTALVKCMDSPDEYILDLHNQAKSQQLKPFIPGLRPLMPRNPSHGPVNQHSVQRFHLKQEAEVTDKKLRMTTYGGSVRIIRPSLDHIVGLPQTTQELQKLRSPNSWSKHPCLMMDNLVSQSVPTVTKLETQTVPQKPSMSEIPLKNKTKPQSEPFHAIAPKPWLPAKFPFEAKFTTTLTTAHRVLPVVAVPADSLITGRCVHRVRTGTAVSCAHFRATMATVLPISSAIIRPVMTSTQALKIPTKCSSSVPMRYSLPNSMPRSKSPNVIFSENPEVGLSNEILPFPRSDLYDTFNDIPTEDSSVSEYLSDTDLSISNLSGDGSFSEELFRDISTSGFANLEASRLSLSSSGIDRLIIDESILSANATFQAPSRSESVLSNTSDNRPPSVLSNCSDLSNPSSPVQNKSYKLNSHAVSIMNNWFQSHLDHPYPNNADKADVALLGGITVSQVSSWFTNTRRRSRMKRKKTLEDSQEVPLNKRLRSSNNLNCYY